MRGVILVHPVVGLIINVLSYVSCTLIPRIRLNGEHRGCFTFTASYLDAKKSM
jgi:hypothetical protein